MGSLLRTRRATLNELAIPVAVVRPGPITGSDTDDRLARYRCRRRS